MAIKNLPSNDEVDFGGNSPDPNGKKAQADYIASQLEAMLGFKVPKEMIDQAINEAEEEDDSFDMNSVSPADIQEMMNSLKQFMGALGIGMQQFSTKFTKPSATRLNVNTNNQPEADDDEALDDAIQQYSTGVITEQELNESFESYIMDCYGDTLTPNVLADQISNFKDCVASTKDPDEIEECVDKIEEALLTGFDIDNLVGVNNAITDWYNGKYDADHLFDLIGGPIEERLIDLNGGEELDNSEEIQEAFDDVMEYIDPAGNTLQECIDELNNSIRSYFNDIIYPQNQSTNSSNQQQAFNPFANVQNKQQVQQPTSVFSEKAEELFKREEKKCSICCTPFSEDDFIDVFHISEDELDTNKIDINKFSAYIPEEWKTSFEFITVESQFITKTNNKFVICTLVPNFAKTDNIPVSFAVYKSESGEFKTHFIKERNVLGDSGELYSLNEIYTPEYIEYAKSKMQDADDPSGMMSLFPGMMNPQQAQPDEDLKLKNRLYSMILASKIGYDAVFYKTLMNAITVVGVENPLMSLSRLGTLEKDTLCKQDNGYIYVGKIKLNMEDEEVRYFVSDFNLKPENDRIEFYVKMGNDAIENRLLPKAKEYIENNIDFDSDVFSKHTEMDVHNGYVYILSNEL